MNKYTKEEIEKHAPPKEVLIEMVVELQRAAAKLYDEIQDLKVKNLILEKGWNLPSLTKFTG